jgi:hypothetical protein
MMTITFKPHPSGGLLIEGFTPETAMALCLKIQKVEHRSMYPSSNGSIWKMSSQYTVYTTGMALQLALIAIDNPKNYEFVSMISEQEVKKGYYNNEFNLSSFNFTDNQFKAVAKIDKPIRTLLNNPNLKTDIDCWIVREGQSLDSQAVISSIFQFTGNTPLFATTFDSGGRSMDEGFGTAVIAQSPDGMFVPYMAVCNEGQEVNIRDLKENYNNSSFLLFSPQKNLNKAFEELLKKYDECIDELNVFIENNKHIEYLNECMDEGEGFEEMTNFMQSFGYCFDDFEKESFNEARTELSNILNRKVFYKLKTEDNCISDRELQHFRNLKEFKSFNFVVEEE